MDRRPAAATRARWGSCLTEDRAAWWMLVQLAASQAGRGEPECQTGAATRVRHGQLVPARRTTSPHPHPTPTTGGSAGGGEGGGLRQEQRHEPNGGTRPGGTGNAEDDEAVDAGGRCRRIRHDPDLPDPQGSTRDMSVERQRLDQTRRGQVDPLMVSIPRPRPGFLDGLHRAAATRLFR